MEDLIVANRGARRRWCVEFAPSVRLGETGGELSIGKRHVADLVEKG
jgi:hypothetical protein